ncbi:MAG: hypothetical protein KJ804_05760 [Proteobacteria bacterium]|nr:hypothetical protein [Pseudomonadota bacterium]MBU1057808.1 hypothetical protein [Pseudomonadota bacterium]
MKTLYALATVFFLSWLVSGSALAGELVPLYPGYPEVFDIQGSLDLKGDNRLVINDLNYRVRSSTSYHNPKGRTSLAGFSERDRVGALLVANSMEIKSLWLIKDAAPVVKQKNVQEKASTVKQENGVWKN